MEGRGGAVPLGKYVEGDRVLGTVVKYSFGGDERRKVGGPEHMLTPEGCWGECTDRVIRAPLCVRERWEG